LAEFSRFQHSFQQLFTSQNNETKAVTCHRLSDYDGSCRSKHKTDRR